MNTFKNTVLLILLLLQQAASGQQKALDWLLADSCMKGSSVSICIINNATGRPVFEYNSTRSLVPASIQKLITSAAGLELLGSDYTFTTRAGYSGIVDNKSGILTGNIVITGGGDPALGSENFREHYGNFLNNWVASVKKAGIKKVKGMVITDDSRYDYKPVPPKWIWEDLGNYYGAGSYGLSLFDNTYKIHFRTSEEGSVPVITRIVPEECSFKLSNFLIASGKTDNGYIFSAPYSEFGWIAGTIPANRTDFVLNASIPDPPLLMARITGRLLDSAGIRVTGSPTTSRIAALPSTDEINILSEVVSPPLSEIINVLNHESINLYAEHILRELGWSLKNSGTTKSGTEVIYRFLKDSGINTDGINIEDGSGLSPMNSVTSQFMAALLSFMKNNSSHFTDFYNSLPEAGKNGTLKNYFKDPVFDSNLRAKSGSMTRVRNYAGYFRTKSGNEMSFCIIINNFSGPHQRIISAIEEILKEVIINC